MTETHFHICLICAEEWDCGCERPEEEERECDHCAVMWQRAEGEAR